MTIRSVVLVPTALLSLVGCVTPAGYFDLVASDNPSVASGATSTPAGELIEVAVTSTVRLPALSTRTEQAYAYRLGVCLAPIEPPTQPNACGVSNAFHVPDGVVLAEGAALPRAGEVTVCRGQTPPSAAGSRLTPATTKPPSGCSDIASPDTAT